MPTQFGDVKRTLGTGDIVIPVSEVFDRLQSKVDPGLLEAVLRDILSGRRERVRPGELITAELMNQILAQLESLEVRVAKLEAGGVVTPPPAPTPLKITGLLPKGSLHVKDTLTIIGQNFVKPAENNVVSVAGIHVPADLFKFGSDDTHLIFQIPAVPNLAALSQPITVTVKNKNGSDSASLTLLPEFHPPTGRIEMAYVAAPVMPDSPEAARRIQPGTPYIFTYSIAALVDKDSTYEVNLKMDGWNPTLLNDSGNQKRDSNVIPIPVKQVSAQFEGRKDIRVQVTPPAGVKTATLQIDVLEKSGFGKVSPGQFLTDITVGEFPPNPEDRVKVNLSLKTVAPPPAMIVGSKAQFKRGTAGAITFVFASSTQGDYKVDFEIRQPAGWKGGDDKDPKLSLPGFKVPTETKPNEPNRFEGILILKPGAEAKDTDVLLTVSSVAGAGKPVKYAQMLAVID